MAASGGKMSAQKVDMEEDLKFQDIPHSIVDVEKAQTHSFTDFPRSQIEDSEEEQTGDQSELLRSEKQTTYSFWTFEYYQQYFNVDTQEVGARLLGSMIPNPRKNFLQSYIRPNPDLYGPFWICTTLVFTIAIAGNVANYIQSSGKDYHWVYDFHKVTFTAAAIYSYWWVIPTLIWGLLLWRRSRAGVTFLELICIYGYSLSIYIPISLLWVIQVSWLQWLLVVLGMVMSGAVLVITLWPAVKDDDKKIAFTVMALIVIFHGLLAVGFMLYFFHVPSASSIPHTTESPIVTTLKSIAENTTKATKLSPAVKRTLSSGS